jgi:hypothetical protein
MKRAVDDEAEEKARLQTTALQVLTVDDILMYALHQHPLRLLRLLSANKQLANLLRRQPHFFLSMLDAVMHRELQKGVDKVELGEGRSKQRVVTDTASYVFYAWEFHRGDFRHLMQLVTPEREKAMAVVTQIVVDVDLTVRYNIPSRHWNPARRPVEQPALQPRATMDTRFSMPTEKLASETYLGRGNDIVVEAAQPEYSSLCEIMRLYRPMRNRWAEIEKVTEDQRRMLCRLFTRFYPYQLGPLVLLDTRRLRLHRILLSLVREAWSVDLLTTAESMRDAVDAARLENDDREGGSAFRAVYNFLPFIFNASQSVQMRRLRKQFSDSIEIAHEVYGTGYDENKQKHAEADFDRKDAARLEKLRATLDRLAALAPDGAFARTRRLLDKPLPSACLFVDVRRYRAKLQALNADSATAKHTLVGELHYLERQHGLSYIVTHYGACVRCTTRTPYVHALDRVFVCAQCHAPDEV